MKNTIEVNDSNFSQVTSENENLLIDFYATWCGPCKMISPILDELSLNKEIKTTIAKVNVDHSPDLSALMKIRQVPSIFFFKNGKPTSKLDQTPTLKNLIDFIKKNE